VKRLIDIEMDEISGFALGEDHSAQGNAVWHLLEEIGEYFSGNTQCAA
jgi:hypothetical protein